MKFLIASILMLGAVSEPARKLHDEAFVFDAHVHMIDRQFYHGGDIGDRVKDGHVDLPRAKEGGIDAMFFSIFVTEDYYPQRLETKQTLRLLDLALTQIEKNKDKIEVALTASDIDRIHLGGRIAAILDVEGGFDLDGDLGILRNLHRLGVRSLQLSAHNWANNFADSCCAAPKFHGLNAQGRAVIAEMNRLGMVINVSHSSDETLSQAIDASSQPVVATHHGLRMINNIPRNMPENLMRKLAAKGGVMGFQIGNEFHNLKAFNWRTKNAGKPFWDTSEIANRKQTMTIEEIDRKVAPQFPMVGLKMPDEVLFGPEDWIAVVEKAIAIIGEDHVALGSDFDGGPTLPRGMHDIADLPMLTEAMLKRGWSERRIRKFLGGNMLRVFREINTVGEQKAVSFPAPDGGVVQGIDYGSSERAVLLVHGGRFYKESWHAQAQALVKAGFRVLSIDLRGYGKSTGPGLDAPKDPPFEQDALGAVSYLKQTGAKSISAICGSMGCSAVGPAATAAGGALFDRMVFLGTGTDTQGEKLQGRKLFIIGSRDANSAGLRLPRVQAEYDRTAEPKRLILIDDSAHAQYLFDTPHGPGILKEILSFLTAP